MRTSAAPPPPASRSPTWTEDAAARAARAFAAGGVYFLAIGVASWAFGRLRDTADQRHASGAWTTLIAAPALLLLLALVAAAAIRLFRVRDRAGDRLLVGSFGVTLLVAAEFVGGPLVRDWGLYETLTRLMPEPSGLFLGLLVGAVLTPLLEPLGRARRGSRASD